MGRKRHSFKGFHHGINPKKITPSSHWVQGRFSHRNCPDIGPYPIKELNPDSLVVQLFTHSFLHFFRFHNNFSLHRVSLHFKALWLTPQVFFGIIFSHILSSVVNVLVHTM